MLRILVTRPIRTANAVKLYSSSKPFELREEDLMEQFIRSSGPGGQHVNKVSSCVYLVHRPTGISVKCQDTRYLEQNRKIARKRLGIKVEHALNPESSKVAIELKKNRRRKSKRARRSRLKYGAGEDDEDQMLEEEEEEAEDEEKSDVHNGLVNDESSNNRNKIG
jgi:peptide chain release factor